jgi:site-specific DNA-methyltransferase (adenine-specific)
VNCKAKFSRSHAHLFHFVKDPERFTFRADELENRIPSARYLVYGDTRANPVGRLPDDTWILRPQDLADRFTPDEDTWYFPRVAGTFKERAGFHGCQMPEQLLGRIIRVCSNPGETVLDPFSGSATTLTVAKKLGRQFLGFELSEDYAARGTARLKETCVGDLLDGAVEPTMSAPVTVKPRSRSAKVSPLESIVEAAADAQAEKSQALVQSELVAAFRAISDGYSLDRVIADPALNAALAGECARRGLPGDARLWNFELFRARKAGRLAEVATDKRTEFSWRACDPFLFASEIAWKQMLDAGYGSLDDILCDPEAAAQFDTLAAELAPGFTPLHYRWGALKLRKESKRARSRAAALKNRDARRPFSGELWLGEGGVASLPESEGVYLLYGNDARRPIYAGATLALRDCLARHVAGQSIESWKQWGGPLRVKYLVASGEIPLLLAYQSRWIKRFAPRLNLTELAVQ